MKSKSHVSEDQIQYYKTRSYALSNRNQKFLFIQLFGEYAVYMIEYMESAKLNNVASIAKAGMNINEWKNDMYRLLFTYSPKVKDKEYNDNVSRLVNTMADAMVELGGGNGPISKDYVLSQTDSISNFFTRLSDPNKGGGNGYWKGAITTELRHIIFDFIGCLLNVFVMAKTKNKNAFYRQSVCTIEYARNVGSLLDDILQ